MDRLSATFGAACRDAMEQVTTELKEIRASQNAAIDLFDDKLKTINRERAEQSKKMDALQAENASLKEAIASKPDSDAINAVANDIAGLRKLQNSADARAVDKLQIPVATQDSQARALQELKTKCTRVCQAQEQNREEAKRVTAAVHVLQQGLQKVEERLGGNEACADELRQQLLIVTSATLGMTGRVKTIQNAVAGTDTVEKAQVQGPVPQSAEDRPTSQQQNEPVSFGSLAYDRMESEPLLDVAAAAVRVARSAAVPGEQHANVNTLGEVATALTQQREPSAASPTIIGSTEQMPQTSGGRKNGKVNEAVPGHPQYTPDVTATQGDFASSGAALAFRASPLFATATYPSSVGTNDVTPAPLIPQTTTSTRRKRKTADDKALEAAGDIMLEATAYGSGKRLRKTVLPKHVGFAMVDDVESVSDEDEIMAGIRKDTGPKFSPRRKPATKSVGSFKDVQEKRAASRGGVSAQRTTELANDVGIIENDNAAADPNSTSTQESAPFREKAEKTKYTEVSNNDPSSEDELSMASYPDMRARFHMNKASKNIDVVQAGATAPVRAKREPKARKFGNVLDHSKLSNAEYLRLEEGAG